MSEKLLNFKIESFRCLADSSIMRFSDRWLSQNQEKIKQEFVIHSVKRLNDGEVFSIGDTLLSEADEHGIIHSAYCIEEFIQHENRISVKLFCHVDRHFTIEKWEKAILMFITQDGFDTYQQQEYWYITTEAISPKPWMPKKAITDWDPKLDYGPLGQVQFSSKYQASEYIKKHGPILQS